MANVYIPEGGGDPSRLPHFTNIPVAADLWEPIYQNLFEINFILPEALSNQGRDNNVMTYNSTSIPFDLTPDIGTVEQRYKYSTRAYVTMPDTATTKEFAINFNYNQNPDLAIVVWNTLKAWYDLVWNSQTGELNYKRDIVGTIITNQHDRRGEVIRQVTYHNCQILGIDGFEFNWDSATICSGAARFKADYWTDLYTDQV